MVDFSVGLGEPRPSGGFEDVNFEKFIEQGKIRAMPGKFKPSNLNDAEGERFKVIADGQVLDKGTLQSFKDSNRGQEFKFNLQKGGNGTIHRIADIYPNYAETLPKGVKTLQDLATGLGLEKIRFERIKDKVSSQTGQGNTSTSTKKQASKMGFGVIAVIIGVLGLIAYFLTGDSNGT